MELHYHRQRAGCMQLADVYIIVASWNRIGNLTRRRVRDQKSQKRTGNLTDTSKL